MARTFDPWKLHSLPDVLPCVPPQRRSLVRLTLFVLFCAGGLVLLTRLQRAMLFQPNIAPTDEPRIGRTPGLERWWHESDEGPVEAFFLPGDGVDAAHPGPVVIDTHGNAEVIDPLPGWLAPYRRMGVSVLLPEYRGYGRSAGCGGKLRRVANPSSRPKRSGPGRAGRCEP